jgi:NTE family protein
MKIWDRIKQKYKNKWQKANNLKNDKQKPKKYRVGLSLGGGGTRGFAHLGALKAFEEEGIKFDYIAGTSVGSLVGALYASGMTANDMIEQAKELRTKDIKTSKLPFVPNKTEKLEEILKEYIGDAVFSDLKKPLSVVAVDIISGKEVHLESGNVIKAVAGSCAVPAIFNPVEFGEYMLMDGGLTNTIPSDVVRNKGCKYVIAVDVNPDRGYGTNSTKLIDVLAASVRIMMKGNAEKGRLFADIVIDPNTRRFKASSVEGGLEMIEEGYNATMERMPEIKKLLKIKQRKQKLYNKVINTTMQMENVIEE